MGFGRFAKINPSLMAVLAGGINNKVNLILRCDYWFS